MFVFYMFNKSKSEYDAGECQISFSIINYTNQTGLPILSKSASVSIGESGVANMATVKLDPEDTVTLSGRYIYQISIRDSLGDAEIPGQGILEITKNTNQPFITMWEP